MPATQRIAVDIGAYITRAIGPLRTKKASLQKQIVAVEREIANVQRVVVRQLGREDVPTQRVFTVATRRKMALAAKARWRAAKRAGKNRLVSGITAK